MLLHEAVVASRKELGLSQKKLAELAGIQRRQLATLEKGGNVTLVTLRKVLAKLPNLESFSLDAVNVKVTYGEPTIDDTKFAEAMDAMGKALTELTRAFRDRRTPSQDDIDALKGVTAALHASIIPPDEPPGQEAVEDEPYNEDDDIVYRDMDAGDAEDGEGLDAAEDDQAPADEPGEPTPR